MGRHKRCYNLFNLDIFPSLILIIISSIISVSGDNNFDDNSNDYSELKNDTIYDDDDSNCLPHMLQFIVSFF